MLRGERPVGAVVLLVDNACPALTNDSVCAGDMLHFDLSEPAFPLLTDTHFGNSSVSFRMVACGFDRSMVMKIAAGSSEWCLGFNVLFANVLVKTIAVRSDGGEWEALVYEFGQWRTCSHRLGFPLEVQFVSIAGEAVTTTLDAVHAGERVEVGGNFHDTSKWFDVETNAVVPRPAEEDACCDLFDDWTVVYDDAMRGVWFVNSANANHTLQWTTDVASGTYCMQVVVRGWRTIQLKATTSPPRELYRGIAFDLRVERVVPRGLQLYVLGGTGDAKFSPNSTDWEHFVFSFEELGVEGKMSGFGFTSYSDETQTFYLDNVELVKVEGATVARCANVSSASASVTLMVLCFVVVLFF